MRCIKADNTYTDKINQITGIDHAFGDILEMISGGDLLQKTHQTLRHEDEQFIDKGKKDGIQRGQFFNVYYQISERIHPKKREQTLLLPVDLAELLVIHTEDTTATVIVTSADREFEPGSKIRSPIE